MTATWLHPQPQGLALPCRKQQVLLWAGAAARCPCDTPLQPICISAGKLNPVPLDVALHEGAQRGWGWCNAVALGMLRCWGYCYVWDAAMLGMQWCWGYYYVWDAVMLGML